MTIVCASGVRFNIRSEETVAIALDKKEGEAFDLATDRWESDRAWMFAKPGKLIVHQRKVELIAQVTG